MSYFKNINLETDIATVSTANSNDANVAANTIWSGDFEDIVNQTGIQFIAKYNQETTIYCDQSIDGISATITDSWDVNKNTGFTTTIASAAPYYRIRVNNHNLTEVAQGQIVSAKTAVINPLPRRLSSTDGLTSTISGISDSLGFDIAGTPNCELRVVEPYRLVGTQFSETTLDSNFWTFSNAAGGSYTMAGDILLDTVTTANAYSKVTSVRVARYVPACSNRFRSQITLGDTGETKNSRKWGCFSASANDGCYFELDGTSIYVVTKKGGSATRLASTSWNGNRVLPTITNCNTWEIYWNNKSVWFTINDILAHKVTATSTVWSNTLNLGIVMSTTNTLGLNTTHKISTRTMSIFRMGKEITASIYKYLTTGTSAICKYSAGVIHSVTVGAPTAAAGLCTIADNAAGTTTNPITVLDLNKSTGVVGYIQLNCSFYTGLSVTTTGSGGNVTIIYE